MKRLTAPFKYPVLLVLCLGGLLAPFAPAEVPDDQPNDSIVRAQRACDEGKYDQALSELEALRQKHLVVPWSPSEADAAYELIRRVPSDVLLAADESHRKSYFDLAQELANQLAKPLSAAQIDCVAASVMSESASRDYFIDRFRELVGDFGGEQRHQLEDSVREPHCLAVLRDPAMIRSWHAAIGGGMDFFSYRQASQQVSEGAISAIGWASYSLRERWEAVGDFRFFLIPFNANPEGAGARLFNFNLLARRRWVLGRKWCLAEELGFGYTTLFSPVQFYGFSNLAGPRWNQRLSYAMRPERDAALTLHLGLNASDLSATFFHNSEVGLEASYEFRDSELGALEVALAYRAAQAFFAEGALYFSIFSMNLATRW